ncbi:UDP-galactopyranose mutase [Pedobacter psychrophilus]|uniref:UDP-galactopyranose mutase n=1 Tax=Pedobacter psychrophilus TaxID=1826909 RepID=A0A179DD33_9SPHI|nr:NAD(P)-binding protein [Pedobacter psychrophilus]OAQ38610.1 UDP-galactopyranose mutase [Pedobacter psychrophilus]
MKIAVLGSGISGLSIAHFLSEENNVSVLEIKNKIGGLIKCERVNDCLFHKVGGHVFNAKNEKVFNWFWSFFDKDEEFITAKRNAKVFFNKQIIGYPIENYVYTLDKTLINQIIDEQIEISKNKLVAPKDYNNFEDFLIGNFGNTLFEIYFKPYNTKLWKTDLKDVSMEWLEGKLPMPNFSEIIKSNILREEEDTMVHSSFYYPKNEGSQFIVNRLSQGLNITENFKIEDIEFQDNLICINGEFFFDKLIYTGDIRRLPIEIDNLLISGGIDLEELKALKSNGTSNLFCETDNTEISWLYIPEPFTKAHRIIYTGNFSDSNNRGSSRKTCVVEFSGKISYEEMIKELISLPGNLKPLSWNYEQNSYVIQDHKTKSLMNRIKKILETKHIYLLGRFAEWEYYNMDKAIEAAMSLANKIKRRNLE